MRAKTVNFERNQDPIKSMGIGYGDRLKAKEIYEKILGIINDPNYPKYLDGDIEGIPMDIKKIGDISGILRKRGLSDDFIDNYLYDLNIIVDEWESYSISPTEALEDLKFEIEMLLPNILDINENLRENFLNRLQIYKNSDNTYDAIQNHMLYNYMWNSKSSKIYNFKKLGRITDDYKIKGKLVKSPHIQMILQIQEKISYMNETINFNRYKEPKEALKIGSHRIRTGQDLIDAFFHKLYDDLKDRREFSGMDHIAFKDELYNFILMMVEDHGEEDLQLDKIGYLETMWYDYWEDVGLGEKYDPDYNAKHNIDENMDFERNLNPKKSMKIGSHRILQGQELIDAIVDEFWPSVSFETYSREAGKPTKADVIEWAETLIEEADDLESVQPDNISISDFIKGWDMY